MMYGEFLAGVVKNEKNILFININWGLGAGIIIDGKPYYGKSGFSGEIGHVCALDNEIICNCGKKVVWKQKLLGMPLNGCCTNGKLKAVHLSYGI